MRRILTASAGGYNVACYGHGIGILYGAAANNSSTNDAGFADVCAVYDVVDYS